MANATTGSASNTASLIVKSFSRSVTRDRPPGQPTCRHLVSGSHWLADCRQRQNCSGYRSFNSGVWSLLSCNEPWPTHKTGYEGKAGYLVALELPCYKNSLSASSDPKRFRQIQEHPDPLTEHQTQVTPSPLPRQAVNVVCGIVQNGMPSLAHEPSAPDEPDLLILHHLSLRLESSLQ